MKRAICVAAIVTALAAVGGCSPAPDQPTRDAAGNATGWTQPPRILSVRRAMATLIFAGQAEPGARVALRNDERVAYAAAADPDGRFEIRMAAPAGALLLRPETQIGQDAAVSAERLLIIDGGRGPIAVLRPGGPARRLDPGPALGAIDSDDESRLASGVAAAAGRRVEIEAGGEQLQALSADQGQWSVLLGTVAPGATVRVGDQSFVWPGPGTAGAPLVVERAGEGWRVGWTGPGGAVQWTWLPDAPAGR